VLGRAKVESLARALRRSATAAHPRIEPLDLSVVEPDGFRAALDCVVLFCSPTAWTTAERTACGSRREASATKNVPSRNSSASSPAACNASRVFPDPPAPVSVTSRRASATRLRISASFPLAAEERPRRDREIGSTERPEGWEVAASELVDALGGKEVLEAVLTEVANVTVHERGRRLRHEHLSSMA
jgi:hypothetical protein